jgi:hypothetical protein
VLAFSGALFQKQSIPAALISENWKLVTQQGIPTTAIAGQTLSQSLPRWQLAEGKFVL